MTLPASVISPIEAYAKGEYDRGRKEVGDALQPTIDSLTAQLAQSLSDDAASEATITALQTEVRRLQAIIDGGTPPPPPPPPDPGTTTGVVLGTSFGGPVGTKLVLNSREYDIASVNPKAIAKGVKSLDASSRDDTKNPATVVSRIKATFARFPQIDEIDYFHENEADRTDHRGGSDADMTAWANECKAIFTAIKAERWPAGKTVRTGVDMTKFGTQGGRSQKMMQKLKDIGALPDVYGSSMYGGGREKSPAVKDDPRTHIGICIDVAVQFGIKLVSCLEIACPLSPNYDRAAYVATWAPWAAAYAKSKGIQLRHFDYWNGAKAGDVDNRFSADGTTDTTVGKTEAAFFASLK